MAKVSIIRDISPLTLARKLLPPGATQEEIDALRDKILLKNSLVKGQKITAGEVVKVGKKIAPNTFEGKLTDRSTTNRFNWYKNPPVEQYFGGSRAVPQLPARDPQTPREDIKIASPDIVLLEDQALDIDIMTDLIFENIGGQEIINIARNDIINGQSIIYQPITNASSLALLYSSANILSQSNNSKTFFDNFPIKFEEHVPNVGTGPNGEVVYLEPGTNNLIINVIGLAPDERVEVELLNEGTVLNDTIYEGQI